MKWRLAQWSPLDRWYPVLVRYTDYISRRLDGLGGNSSAIQPSPWGVYGSPKSRPYDWEKEESCEERHGRTGKVTGLIFDRYGDFEGFVLDEWEFFSREKDLEKLAERAWRERLRITVYTCYGKPHRPETIIIREPPALF